MRLKLSFCGYYGCGGDIMRIVLPKSNKEIENFISKLPNNNPVQYYQVKECDTKCTICFEKYFENIEPADIFEWNLLAKELEKFEPSHEISMECLLDATIFVYHPNVFELINLSRNTLAETYIFLDCSNVKELFECNKYKLGEIIPSLKDLNEKEINSLDPEQIGKQIMRKQGGVFVDNLYIAFNYYLKDLYDGNYTPISNKESDFNNNSQILQM